MNHGSLFSGIGGFDLAASWMGWENKFHCEQNEFGRKILNYYWSKAKSYEDIKETDFTIWRGKIDVLTGGFPCQPYSQAGKRKGKEDERHLWPEMLRAIREIRPRYVVAENVFGLINWNNGLVFDEVQTDLEAKGYEVQAYVLPACAIGAPHRRDRIWFVAYSNNNTKGQSKIGKNNEKGASSSKQGIRGHDQTILDSRLDEAQGTITNANSKPRKQNSQRGRPELRQERQSVRSNPSSISKTPYVANTQGKGLEGMRRKKGRYSELFRGQNELQNWKNFPTESPICDGNDGISTRLDGITFPKWRNESIKGGGNAIVPQVAYEIFKVIEQLK